MTTTFRWLRRYFSPANSQPVRTGRRKPLKPFRLELERLEDRLAPAVITVTGTGDTIAIDGLATLREAVTSINNHADVGPDVTLNRVGAYASTPGGTPDVINFNIPSAGVQTIAATGAEPTITRPLTINGYTQAGASVNTLANADNAVILIRLDGTSAGANVNALTLGVGSDGSTIKGLDVTNFSGNGIVVQSDSNFVVGNFIGVEPTGTTRMPNGTFPNSGDGIRILNANNNQIGSTNAADRNITSGNALDGIHVMGTLTTPAIANIIQGNFVGVAADGKSSVGNRTEPAPAPGAAEGNNLFGIEISGGNLNTVGGTTAGARNVVGLNGAGIEVDNGGQQNTIQGNFSGVGADGVTPAGNLLQGIVLRSSNGFSAPFGPAQPNEPGVSNNSIGGTAAGAGNLVEFNGTGGVAVFGNPVSISGQPNVGNIIEGNSIFENGRASSPAAPLLGIDLTNGFLFPKDDGPTPNDSKGHGAANDPNNFQNFPVLGGVSRADGGGTTITGSLTQSVSPNTTFRIEFFANNADPLNLPAEGQQFLGFTNVTTDASGNRSFSVTLPPSVTVGRLVTATATDPVGNTSEFSAAVAVGALPVLDSFTQSNGSGLGSIWTQQVGSFVIQNNKANGNAPLDLATIVGVSSADVVVQADVTLPNATDSQVGLVARYSGSGDTADMYWGFLFSAGGTTYGCIFRHTNAGNAWTPLNIAAVPGNPITGKLRFEVIGNSLQLFLNGGLIASAVDASPLMAPGSVGMRALANTQLDNFSAKAVFTDTFTQANGTPLNAASWTVPSGSFTVNNNVASAAAGINLATLNGLSEADVRVEADMTLGANSAVGLVTRDSGSDYYFATLIDTPSGTFAAIYRHSSNGFALLSASAVPVAGNPKAGKLRFDAIGNSLTLSLNGTQITAASDGALTSGSAGMLAIGSGTFDNFRETPKS